MNEFELEEEKRKKQVVRDSLMNKFDLGNYSDDNRSQITNNQPNGIRALQSITSAIGAGFGGRDPVAAASNVYKDQEASLNNQLNQFDKGRANKIQEYSLNRQLGKDSIEDDKINSENDPESDVSLMAQAFMQRLTPGKSYKGISKTKIDSISPTAMKLYELDQKKAEYNLARKNKATTKALEKPDQDYKSLPKEKQISISGFATDNAKQGAIKNSIDSFLKEWETLDDEERLTQGKSFIKTLNSTMGSDAAGAEEVKRLAGYLEYAFGNFTNDNPTQFGRDLEGFRKQVQNTSNQIGGTLKLNQADIDKAYGRTPVVNSNKEAKLKEIDDEIAALEAMEKK